MTASEPRVGRYCRILAEATSLAAIGVGALVLAGWAWDVGALFSVPPGHATMKPNTAVCFILSGIGLRLLRAERTPSPADSTRRLAAHACGALVAAVGLLTFAEELLSVDIGIDALLFPNRLDATGITHPGRMSPATALSVFLLGVTVLSLDAASPRIRRLSPYPALAVCVIGLIALLGYVYGVETLSMFYTFRAMTLHTALALIVLGIGALCARPDRGVVETFTSEHVGGVMVRRVLPVVTILPIALGWFRLMGQRAGLYGTEAGLVLFVTANISIAAAVVWLNARSLNRIDAERARIETHLRQSQKLQALGTLAGGIAHDFNNILTIIVGNVELAAARVPHDHPARKNLEEIEKAGARASDLVRRILIFSRPHEAGFQPVGMAGVVDDALKLLRATLPASIDIRAEPAPILPHILADASQIHQIILNLGTNAAHAMREHGGALEIRIEPVDVGKNGLPDFADLREGRYVRLSVIDSGTGMDPATLERIFEPFFTTKPPGQGVGLGLSVVHGMMNNHHGAISVKSRLGHGTTFDLYFPAADAPTVSASPARLEPARGDGKRILFVDDEEALVILMTRFLEEQGYHVTGFTDPSKALDAFRSQPDAFDVVVTDVSMPGMSGPDLTRHILRIRPAIPVVMTSGYVQPEDQAAMQRLGVRALIFKPNTIHELGTTLSRLLEENIRRTTHPST